MRARTASSAITSDEAAMLTTTHESSIQQVCRQMVDARAHRPAAALARQGCLRIQKGVLRIRHQNRSSQDPRWCGGHKAFTGSVCNTRLSQDPPPPQRPHKIQKQTWNLSRSTIPPDPPRDPFWQMRGPVEIQVATKVQYRSHPQTRPHHRIPVHPSIEKSSPKTN